MNIILVYEEIPERTVVLHLRPEDLEAAKLTYEEVASIHGTLLNTELTEVQEAVHEKLHQAIFGERNESTRKRSRALWQDRKIFQTGDEDLDKEGIPPMVSGDFIVVCTGFEL